VKQQEGNKASIHFQTDHSRGSLVKVLEPIAKLGVNLSKLQSVPIPGREWRYGFHADLEFDNGDQLEEVLQVIRPLTRQLDILGIYQKGKTISR
jgi:prephenate dehydratase